MRAPPAPTPIQRYATVSLKCLHITTVLATPLIKVLAIILLKCYYRTSGFPSISKLVQCTRGIIIMNFLSVTLQACRGYSFKGFLLQPRLAQFATQDVKIGVFGIYNNAPYQYTCPDTRNVSDLQPGNKQ